MGHLKIVLWSGVCACLVLGAESAVAEPITYQGVLNDAGKPAVGLYDLEFKLFDSFMDGVQIGETFFADDVFVIGGLINAQFDAPDVFDSTEMYLQVGVRAGESEEMDPFDMLVPRQQITRSPKAFHALRADSLTGPGWSVGSTIFGGDVLRFGNGGDRVVINREDLIAPIEFFGVHIAGLSKGGSGGVVISNEDPTGGTLIAHSIDGAISATQAFSGKSQEWTLTIGQSASITAGSAGVETAAMTAPSYAYTTPVAQAVTVAGDVFHSVLGTPFVASFFSAGAYISEAGVNTPMVAPITLPHGATITKMIGRFEDNAGGMNQDLMISLTAAKADGSLSSVATVQSKGAAAGIQSVDTVEIMDEVVDGFGTGYYIRAFCPSWPGDMSLRIWSVTVEYTVPGPN
ncbi:MAG: hypothetical protein AB8C13_01910 [Phycisphaerales bacterium]